MPGDCAPWPGNRKATGAPDQGALASKKRPRGSSSELFPLAMAACARRSFSVRSSRDVTTMAIRASPERVSAAARLSHS